MMLNIIGKMYLLETFFSKINLDDPAGADISAAILVNRAIIAEIPPSALLIPKVSKSQNKCQK